jgi:hypothetical protein
MDTRAGEIAAEVATALEADPVDASVRTALENRFGLPPVFANGRSMNRLSGASVADQDTAIAGELGILARRYRLSARLFTQPIFYRCVGPEGGSSIAGCTVTNATCANGDALSCTGIGAIFMCSNFWTRFGSTDERALVLVHVAGSSWRRPPIANYILTRRDISDRCSIASRTAAKMYATVPPMARQTVKRSPEYLGRHGAPTVTHPSLAHGSVQEPARRSLTNPAPDPKGQRQPVTRKQLVALAPSSE